jgi:hypothetical protein
MREISEFDRNQPSDLDENVREIVRGDGSNLRRLPEIDTAAGNIGSLLQRASGTSVQEIDRLIAQLQTLRDMLNHEGRRVQHEVAEYATMSQAALQSTRIIAETLHHWKSAPDAPSISA